MRRDAKEMRHLELAELLTGRRPVAEKGGVLSGVGRSSLWRQELGKGRLTLT